MRRECGIASVETANVAPEIEIESGRVEVNCEAVPAAARFRSRDHSHDLCGCISRD